MTTTETEIYMKLNTNNADVANALTKSILEKMSVKQLDLIKEMKVTQLLMELEVTNEEFETSRQK